VLMLVVVDANRFLSALLSKGKVFSIFLLNNIANELEFISPEFLFFEIGRNLDVIVERSKLPSEELANVFMFIKGGIDFVPFNDFNMFGDEAEKLAPHGKDVQYFSLALAKDAAIWSDEVAFKRQSKVKVFNTDEIIELLLSKFEDAA